jgi:hypothetical protein
VKLSVQKLKKKKQQKIAFILAFCILNEFYIKKKSISKHFFFTTKTNNKLEGVSLRGNFCF